MITKEQFQTGHSATVLFDVLVKLFLVEDSMFHEILDQILNDKSKRGIVHHGLRVLLTGKDKTPPNKDIILILGIAETKRRIKKAIEKIDDMYALSMFYPELEMVIN